MDMKDQKLATEIAEERMTLIAPLLSQNLDKDSVRLIRAEICERNQISQRTLERYLTSYLKGGFDALKPQSRSAECKYKIPQELLNSVYTRSGQNSTPNSNATNLHSSQKRCCSFCISSSNASPTFQVQKSIFHQMTKPIQVTVILPLLLAISLSWNDDIHSSISGISNDLIGVIPTIGQ